VKGSRIGVRLAAAWTCSSVESAPHRRDPAEAESDGFLALASSIRSACVARSSWRPLQDARRPDQGLRSTLRRKPFLARAYTERVHPLGVSSAGEANDAAREVAFVRAGEAGPLIGTWLRPRPSARCRFPGAARGAWARGGLHPRPGPSRPRVTAEGTVPNPRPTDQLFDLTAQLGMASCAPSLQLTLPSLEPFAPGACSESGWLSFFVSPRILSLREVAADVRTFRTADNQVWIVTSFTNFRQFGRSERHPVAVIPGGFSITAVANKPANAVATGLQPRVDSVEVMAYGALPLNRRRGWGDLAKAVRSRRLAREVCKLLAERPRGGVR
jgi:hypothetical protein